MTSRPKPMDTPEQATPSALDKAERSETETPAAAPVPPAPGSVEAKRAWAELKAARAAVAAIHGDDLTQPTKETAKPDTQPPNQAKGSDAPTSEKAPDVTQMAAVPAARVRSRHWLAMLSFLVMFVLPCSVTGWYLWERAADQYASTVGFSVRKEEVGSAIELLGGITQLSGSSSSDTDILNRFLTGQELVRIVDDDLDLRRIWSKGNPDVDPIFAYHSPGSIEDLTDYWNRMVKVYYDSGSGLIDVRVLAFTPEDAHAIAEMVLAENSRMINNLSDIARSDALRYAEEELLSTLELLKEARQNITLFRIQNRIINPDANIQGQVGLINTLQTQLATALIDLDLLQGSISENDPRVSQAERKIEVIEARIEDERRKLGSGGSSDAGGAYAELIGQYESLAIDRDFAEESYRAAQAAYGSAQAEARRQSRYLAAHVHPTIAEKAEYPQRILLMSVFGIFSFLLWAIAVLVAYSLKDRR